jgi:hypothetical protein
VEGRSWENAPPSVLVYLSRLACTWQRVRNKTADRGLDNYPNVSIAQVQALAAELVDVQLRVRQVQASISLVRAIGGGWSASSRRMP